MSTLNVLPPSTKRGSKIQRKHSGANQVGWLGAAGSSPSRLLLHTLLHKHMHMHKHIHACTPRCRLHLSKPLLMLTQSHVHKHAHKQAPHWLVPHSQSQRVTQLTVLAGPHHPPWVVMLLCLEAQKRFKPS